jgi:hypothetical protein
MYMCSGCDEDEEGAEGDAEGDAEGGGRKEEGEIKKEAAACTSEGTDERINRGTSDSSEEGSEGDAAVVNGREEEGASTATPTTAPSSSASSCCLRHAMMAATMLPVRKGTWCVMGMVIVIDR